MGLTKYCSSTRQKIDVSPSFFRYILRFSLDPGYEAESRVAELLNFCRSARVSEVMLFTPAEELSPGHLTDDELEHWLAMARPVSRRLADHGIDLSLNPWTTTYHVTRGRSLRPGQSFSKMVGETGYQAVITPCPLCPQWQAYLANQFIRMAQELNPVAIWIEDDWRLHNHEHDIDANPMHWGGCFCDLHLKRFSQTIGQDVDRVELIKNLLAPGEPHPWRATWIDLWRQTLIEPAEAIRAAVQAVVPKTRFGLMSSVPDVHSVEGRDWPQMQKAWGDEPAFLIRPHMQPYSETPAISTTPCVTRQTLANLEGPIEVYPEMENSPRCGPYSKSASYAAWQCHNAAMFGSRGITINHFDVIGNGIATDPAFGAMLAREKPRLDALAQLNLDDRTGSRGLRVLFHPQVAQHRHVPEGADSINDLAQESYLWGRTAMVLGIANTFSRHIVSDGAPYAVNGQTLRAFTDEDIRQLLSGVVLLDGESVQVLVKRGFGECIGIKSARWRTQSESAYAYESINEPDPAVYGHVFPRMTAQRCTARMIEMKPIEGANLRSTIHRYDHTDLFPGMVDFTNPQGGRVISLAYPLDGKAQFFMGFFNRYRRIMLQGLLEQIAPQSEFAHVENHPMHVYRLATEEGLLLAAFNVTMDDVPAVTFRLPRKDQRYTRWRVLKDDGRWCESEVAQRAHPLGITVTVYHRARPLKGIVLRADSGQ